MCDNGVIVSSPTLVTTVADGGWNGAAVTVHLVTTILMGRGNGLGGHVTVSRGFEELLKVSTGS